MVPASMPGSYYLRSTPVLTRLLSIRRSAILPRLGHSLNKTNRISPAIRSFTIKRLFRRRNLTT
jgi:hypothetical protein